MSDLLDSPLENPKGFRFKLWIPLVWLGIFVIGYVFWVFHWPFSPILRVVGFAGFAAYNISAVFLLKWKQPVNNVFVGLSFFWIVILIMGAIYNGGYPFNFSGLIVQGICLVLLTVIYFVVHLVVYRKNKLDANTTKSNEGH